MSRMKAATQRQHTALLLKIADELNRGRIEERFIASTDTLKLHGQCSATGYISVNPVHAVLDTVLHELLHRLNPSWSENVVRQRTSFLSSHMNDREIVALWKLYQARVKKRKTMKRSGV